MQGAAAEPTDAFGAVVLPLLTGGLPELPPPALDPVLDAAAICLAARGPSRTTLSDIARELGVAPSTVYRKVGSVEHAAWLIGTREAHRFLARLPEVVAGHTGPRMVTAFLAAGIDAARSHPVFARILRDEPDFVGRAVTRRLPTMVDQVAEATAPFLSAAMAMGLVRQQDPLALAHWMTRLVTAVLLAPPPGDLHDALDAALLPWLDPDLPGPSSG